MRISCLYGRGEVIWTPDLLVPNQTRYQTALRPDGANEGTRTLDLSITNALLYQTELHWPAQELIIASISSIVNDEKRILKNLDNIF